MYLRDNKVWDIVALRSFENDGPGRGLRRVRFVLDNHKMSLGTVYDSLHESKPKKTHGRKVEKI